MNNTAAVTNQPHCAKVPHVLIDMLPLLNIVVLLRLMVLLVILLVRSRPPVVTLDELRQIARLLCPPNEGMLEKFSCRWPFLGVTLQAQLDEVLESLAEVAFQAWGRVLGNQKEHLHGMDIGIGWLSFGELKGRDTQRPDVSLVIVAALLDYLGGHPEWGADKCVFLGHGRG